MRSSIGVRPVLLCLALAGGVAHAQPADEAAAPAAPAPPGEPAAGRCEQAYKNRKEKEKEQEKQEDLQVPAEGANREDFYCLTLAGEVESKVRESRPVKAKVKAKVEAVKAEFADVQPRITDTPGSQASPAQAAAIASGQPVGTGGGTVAAVDTAGKGLQLVASLAINPASLAAAADGSSERLRWASRFGDVSLVLPLNVDPVSADKGFPYIGGRLRINLAAALRPGALRKQHDEAAKAFLTKYDAMSKLFPEIRIALDEASDLEQCATAIEAQDTDAQTTHCGREVNAAAAIAASASAKDALAKFREEADRKYLSLEGRWDRGDLNADAAPAKDSLFAGYIAGGYNLNPKANGTSFELRGRGGVAYFKDGMSGESQLSYFAAGGAEVAFVRGLQRYTVSLGVEVVERRGEDPPAMEMLDEHRSNHVRIGLSVPLADGKTLSAGVVLPFDGRDPTIAISGDWSLLLGR